MMNLPQTIRSWALAGSLCLGTAQVALPCAFHGYTPEPTLVDILLGSEHVILARLDPTDPKRFAPVEALIGSIDGVEIPLRADAATQSRLGQNPSHTVLFARDGAYGPWLNLAILDPAYRSIVETVALQQDAWIMGDDQDRYDVFARLVNHRSPEIQRLALLELDSADYSVLRRLNIPRIAGLQATLKTDTSDLRPIRILLAGLSGDKRMKPTLSDGLTSAASKDVPYLGAYATALIELGGPKAVGTIVDNYLASDALPVATREKILEALAIHAQTGSKQTKRAIMRDVSDLLVKSPNLAAPVARQFGFRGEFGLSEPIKQAINSEKPKGIEDIFAVNQYIGIADRPAQ